MVDNCQLYSCLMSTYDCFSSYVGLIGATYCHRYTDVKYTSDPAVKNWLLKTKGCFQQLQLDRINQEFPKPKEVPEICTMTDSFGFRTHTACLTNPQHNICNLSLAKIRLIVSAIPSTKTAWRGVTNAYEKMFRYQLKTVIVKRCGISEQLLKVQAPEILDP